MACLKELGLALLSLLLVQTSISKASEDILQPDGDGSCAPHDSMSLLQINEEVVKRSATYDSQSKNRHARLPAQQTPLFLNQLAPDAPLSVADNMRGNQDAINNLTTELKIGATPRKHSVDSFREVATATGLHAEEGGCQGAMCFQGDQMAGTPSQLLFLQEGTRHANRGGLQDRTVGYAGTPWANGKIKYCLAADIDAEVQHAWELAIVQSQKSLPCLTFENVGNNAGHISTSADGDKACDSAPAIFVQSSELGGCWSFVGMLNPGFLFGSTKMKTQLLQMHPAGCKILGGILHELGHALGMVHKQSRPHFDQNLAIHVNISKPAAENSIENREDSQTSLEGGYTSIMHYSIKDSSGHGSPMVNKVDGTRDLVFSQQIEWSQYDVNQLATMYSETAPACRAFAGVTSASHFKHGSAKQGKEHVQNISNLGQLSQTLIAKSMIPHLLDYKHTVCLAATIIILLVIGFFFQLPSIDKLVFAMSEFCKFCIIQVCFFSVLLVACLIVGCAIGGTRGLIDASLGAVFGVVSVALGTAIPFMRVPYRQVPSECGICAIMETVNAILDAFALFKVFYTMPANVILSCLLAAWLSVCSFQIMILWLITYNIAALIFTIRVTDSTRSMVFDFFKDASMESLKSLLMTCPLLPLMGTFISARPPQSLNQPESCLSFMFGTPWTSSGSSSSRDFIRQSAQRRSSSSRDFPVGTKVLLKGFVRSPELNGVTATVIRDSEALASHKRVKVKLLSGGFSHRLQVEAENLELAI